MRSNGHPNLESIPHSTRNIVNNALMGNVPGKLENEGVARPNRSMSASAAQTPSGRNGTTTAGARSQRTSSLVGTLLSSRRRSSSSEVNGNGNPYKRKSTKDKEKMEERHVKQLIVKYNETVDGGFLAPFGSCGTDKLDYDAKVVKNLIMERRLAPFYTPLQDFDDSWSREEVIKIIEALPLHAPFNENLETFEDVPIGDLSQSDIDHLIDKTLSRREQRRMRSKIFKARLYKKRIIWQERENERFLESKIEGKQSKLQSNPNLPSDDLKYAMYSNGAECPICFLYYPQPINMSRCCLQPICSECFVQIKRAEPHFPHDEEDPSNPQDEEKDPNMLTSEPTNCPYCATPDFGITYEAPADRKVGPQGLAPSSYVYHKKDSPEQDSVPRTQDRRGSLASTDQRVVTSDSLRPDWQVKLNKERMRLARRSANATAIHVSNQLVTPGHQASAGVTSTSAPRSNSNDNTVEFQHSSPTPLWPANATAAEIENHMIEQAIKLSLAEHERENSPKKR